MANKHILWLFLLVKFVLVVLMTKPVGGKVPAVIVFGDSSVDSGNNNQIPTLARSNFGPYGRDFDGGRPTGRFCNGRLPPDFISEAFWLKTFVPAYLDPMYNISDFATGVSFASAGTGYDNATSDVLSVIPLWKELEYYMEYQNKLRAYLGEEKANEVISEGLYLMSLGTNDFLENYYTVPGRRSQFPTVQQYEDFLIGIARQFFTQLHGLGARKISLTGVPPMGCLPLERTFNIDGHDECVKEYNDVGLEFNKKLSDLALDLNKELVGMKVVTPDSYSIILQMIEQPALFGFEVTSKACCGTGAFETSYLCNDLNPFTCEDATKYVFWDSFHLTEKTNLIIAQHILPTLSAEFL